MLLTMSFNQADEAQRKSRTPQNSEAQVEQVSFQRMAPVRVARGSSSFIPAPVRPCPSVSSSQSLSPLSPRLGD